MIPGDVVYPITLGEDEYFVLGDNRQNSRDSRAKSFGYVNKNDIIGIVIKSLIPFKEIK
jgi:signal peptidase I